MFRLFTALLITMICAHAAPRVSVHRSNAPINPEVLKRAKHPWKKNITATVFWIGERPTPRNPTPNHKSSWDTNWMQNYGGFDDPNKTRRHKTFRPLSFIPGQNSFYIALPYNDVQTYKSHKPEASRIIPWFRHSFLKPGRSVCKGRWVQIYNGKKVCYAQWEDCGPFTTDDYSYVFGKSPPKNKKNKGAGIDVSPSVRDFLGMKSGDKVHWRFVEFAQVPRGPWSRYGANNPFVNKSIDPQRIAQHRYNTYLRRLRDSQYTR